MELFLEYSSKFNLSNLSFNSFVPMSFKVKPKFSINLVAIS